MPYSPSRTIRLVGVAALGLILLGAGCRNPFRKPPGEVLSRAQEQMVNATSMHDDVQATFEVTVPKADGPERVHVDMRAQSSVANLASGEIRADGSLAVTVDTKDGAATIAFDQRKLGAVTYVKLTDVTFTPKGPAAPKQEEVNAMLGAVKGIIGGQWVKIDPADIAALAHRVGGARANVAVPSPERVQALTQQVREAMRAHPLLVLRDDLGNETTDGGRAYHYRVGVSRDAVSALVEVIASALGAKPEDIVKARLAIANPEVASVIDRASGEVWIAKSGGNFVRVRFPLDLSAITALAKNPLPGASPTVTGTLDVHYSAWGRPVDVQAPEHVKTLQELVPLLQQKKP